MEQLVSGEEKQRWEGERERLVARIKELQVAATLHLYTLSSPCVQSEREQYQQQVSGARSKEKLRTSAESQVGVLYCAVP